MWARAAIASTECSPATSSSTRRWISRSGSRSGSCAASVALNCDWLPGRRRNRTRWRAIARAMLAVEVLLDEREREVHAGGDARRGPDATVADEDRLGVHEHLGVIALQPRGPRPVGRRAPARRAGRRARAGRRRCRPMRCAAPARGCRDPPHDVRVLGWRAACPDPAGDDQRVERRRHLRQRGVGRDRAGRSSVRTGAPSRLTTSTS